MCRFPAAAAAFCMGAALLAQTPAATSGAVPAVVSGNEADAARNETSPAPMPAITDAERLAVSIDSANLDVHLNAQTGAVTARARLTVHNAGTTPLAHLPLQISSALHWTSARLVSGGANGQAATLAKAQAPLTTDTDHTGTATELRLTLPIALAAGATASVDLFYEGTLAPSAERLLRLGAPESRATESDWDGVSEQFAGLRGFGNVLWFPVAAPAALLADGSGFVHAVDEQRDRAAAATFALRLTLESTATPAAVWFLGMRQPLVLAAGESPSPDESGPKLFTANWPATRLQARPVSLVVAPQTPELSGAGIRIASGNVDATAAYLAAAQTVEPVLDEWLGKAPPQRTLDIVDQPMAHAQAFSEPGLLVLPLQASDAKVLAESLVYPLAAARLAANEPAWMQDGLPEFLRLQYLARTAGRDNMLAELNAGGNVLATQESFRTASSAPLATCTDVPCARTKGAYALTMLVEMLGAVPVQQALAAVLTGGESNATAAFEARLEQTSGKDLRWWFRDWLDTDAGLPELQIVSVAPRRVQRGVAHAIPQKVRDPGGPIGAEPVAAADDPRLPEGPTAASLNRVGPADGSWLVAVEVQNNGDAVADVPVTVRAASLQNSLRLRVPAHGRATIRVPFEAAPEDVWVNDGTTPEVRSVTHHRSIEVPAEAR